MSGLPDRLPRAAAFETQHTQTFAVFGDDDVVVLRRLLVEHRFGGAREARQREQRETHQSGAGSGMKNFHKDRIVSTLRSASCLSRGSAPPPRVLTARAIFRSQQDFPMVQTLRACRQRYDATRHAARFAHAAWLAACLVIALAARLMMVPAV